jgi:transcriptional regulator of acetoin/glycerol metabolism
MQEVFRLVEQVAPARSTVLITGESGTGRIPKAIHEASTRAGRPFVTVNSSNIPSELSELFGHTRGAFTGAVAAKKGLFEVADGGSIFLDEIGDIPPETQDCLRVIQEREFTPLGDTSRRVDVRIVAATNIDLKEAVRQGSFREDLYYRLAVVPIEHTSAIVWRYSPWPSISFEVQRREWSRSIRTNGLEALRCSSRIMAGNVRELENTDGLSMLPAMRSQRMFASGNQRSQVRGFGLA